MNKLSIENFLLKSHSPKKKAMISSSIEYNYDQLLAKVLEISSYLKKENISPGERVGVFGHNDSDYVLNILSLWQIGAVPVLLNLRLNEVEIDEQLKSANCKIILVQNSLSERLNEFSSKVILYPFKESFDVSNSARIELNPDKEAVIIFTSGSIESSKGIILSFRSLYNSAVNGNQLLRYTTSDRWLASLPFYHIGGFSIFTRSILFGIPIILPDSFSTEDLTIAMNKFQPTFISLVAAQLKKLSETDIAPNPEMKNCLLGGGFTDKGLLKKAYDLGWPINIVYGSTETSSFVTALLKDEIIFKPNSVGRAIPTNKILIMDEGENELKPFEIGEITVKSNSLMSGYLNSQRTKRIVKNEYYHTGDIGYIDEEEYLFIEGRKNYLISTGGENVNPVEVENALLEHRSIEEAAVFPIRDKEWGEFLAAAIVLKSDTDTPSFEEMKKFLSKKISGFKIPKKIFFEKELPKTELGKVQKDKLIERYKFTSL